MICNIVFWGAMTSLGVWITLKWRGEHVEVAERIDEVAEIIWEQVIGACCFVLSGQLIVCYCYDVSMDTLFVVLLKRSLCR